MLKKLAIFSLIFTTQINSMEQIYKLLDDLESVENRSTCPLEDLRKDIKTNLQKINVLSCSSEWYLDRNNNIRKVSAKNYFEPKELESQFNNTKKVIKKNVIKYGPLVTLILAGATCGMSYGAVYVGSNIAGTRSPGADDIIISAATSASLCTVLASYIGYRWIKDFKSTANKTVELYKRLRNQV